MNRLSPPSLFPPPLSALAALSVLASCDGKAEEDSTADYCGRLQQAVCNCDGSFGADYEGDTCEEATARNDAAQQLYTNGDSEGYSQAQSTCQVDYEALPSECTGETSSDGEDDGSDNDSVGCPDEVPEQFRNIWDCAAISCPGGTLIYHYGVGESTADDPSRFEVSEQWFMFETSSWCVDTWVIEGLQSPLDPATFDAPTAETTWEVTWTMQTPNECGRIWGPLFFPDSTSESGPFSGFLELDTHAELNEEERNQDNGVLVFSDVIQGNSRVHNADYACGTASPLDSNVDAPPESYEWVGEIRAGCSRMTATETTPNLDGPRTFEPLQTLAP